MLIVTGIRGRGKAADSGAGQGSVGGVDRGRWSEERCNGELAVRREASLEEKRRVGRGGGRPETGQS